MKRFGHIIIVLILCALVFLLFGKTLNNHFNSDDFLVVYQASQTNLTPAEAIKEFGRPSWGLYYRPLITIFFDLMENQFGIMPLGYHLVSLLCYSILCIEVFFLGLLLMKEILPAFAAALIFMTMTAHGEAIFWISSLNGVVENIFTLASLIFFMQWKNRAIPFFYLASLGLFFVALFLKESAVALPLVLILYDAPLGGGVVWPEVVRRPMRNIWPFLLVALVFITIRWAVMKQITLPPPLTSFNFRTALLGSWQVVLMTFSPIDWALAVKWFNRLEAFGFLFYFSAALLLVVLFLLPLLFKKLRLLFLLGWVFAGIVPILLLGLAPSERHVVFSSAGAALFIGIALFAAAERLLSRNLSAAKACAFILALVLSVTSFFFLNQRRVAWKTASDIAANILAQTVAAYPAPRTDETFFFLNVPDTHDGAFIFRFENLTYALRLAYQGSSVRAIRIITPERISPQVFANSAYAYFRISAMGGNVSYGNMRNNLEFSGPPADFLSRNPSFISNWPRYSASPFLVYSQGRLIPSSSDELRDVLQDLYSLT